MKLKFSVIVALCAVMGFVACGKGKKNSSAKIRNANQANAKNNLNNGNTDASKAGVETTTVRTPEEIQQIAAAEKAASDEFSKNELFTAGLEVTGFDAENAAIVQVLNAIQVKPVADELGCRVISKDGFKDKFVEVTIKGTSDEDITTQLKFTFAVTADNEETKNSDVEITSLKIKAIKEDKLKTILEVSKSSDSENSVSYSFSAIESSKLKKHGQETKRLKAAIVATSMKDKNDKAVTVKGTIECAADFTEL